MADILRPLSPIPQVRLLLQCDARADWNASRQPLRPGYPRSWPAFSFKPGESIHTENSYKYSVAEFHALARRASLQPRQVWLDAVHLFSVHYLSVIARSRPHVA